MQSRRTLEVDTPFVPPCQRENDVYIMDVATSAADFSVSDLRRLNFCRLFLQAVTASDIVLPTRHGDTIDPAYRHGDANLQVSPPTTYCPTTQAKPLKGSWNVWRRFCILLEQQLASNPLGDWIISGAELWRVWQCYFDSATKVLYRRHPESESLFYRLYPTTDLDQEVFVTSEEAMSWSPTRASVPVSFYDSPPDSHSPMTRCVVVVGGIALGCPSPLQTPLPPPTSQSFHTYVQTLPLSARQLLSDLEILIPLADLIDVFQATTSIDNAKCYSVSDGSEFSGSMTFGWVIAASDGTRVVTCAGPAFGSQASSYRAEGYGFVSMALFLFHLRHFSSAIPDWRLTFVSDNLGLVTKTSQSWEYDFPFPNLTLSSDYDVIHETVMTLRQARVHATFSHVKGHQDTSKTPFASLSLTAQLNIEADELAGSYRRHHENALHPRIPLLSHTRCLLHLDDAGSITRSYTTSLRTHAATPALHLYMMKRFQWSWDAKLQHAHRQVIKFGFDILPTYAVEARRNPAATSTCPLCSSHPESNDHLYQCHSDSVRTSWRSSTLADIRAVLDKWDAKYGSVEVLMAGIQCAFDPSEASTLDPSAFPTSLHLLIASQNAIGWRHLFRGRASSQWATFQQAEYQLRNPPPPPAISGTGMMTEVLVLLMSQILELWHQLNEFVFSATSNASTPLRHRNNSDERCCAGSHRYNQSCPDGVLLDELQPRPSKPCRIVQATKMSLSILHTRRLFEIHVQLHELFLGRTSNPMACGMTNVIGRRIGFWSSNKNA
eukprot:scaffold7832_cov103-Cylindrotheca_fusiformis.AAC.3